MKLFKVTCILHVTAVVGPKGGYRCYMYIIRNTSDTTNYDKLYSIQCTSCQPDPAQDMMNICYSRNESWRCLFLKMNKTAWKSTHVPRNAFIYGQGPCKSTMSFNSNPDYIIKERMVLWQQGLLVIWCIHRVGIEEAGGFFLF